MGDDYIFRNERSFTRPPVRVDGSSAHSFPSRVLLRMFCLLVSYLWFSETNGCCHVPHLAVYRISYAITSQCASYQYVATYLQHSILCKAEKPRPPRLLKMSAITFFPVHRIGNTLNKSGARRPELGAIIHRAVEGSLPPRDLSQSETPTWSAFGTGIGAAFVIIAGSAAALLGAAGV